MTAAGDTLRSLAEAQGLSKVIKYLDDPGKGVSWLETMFQEIEHSH